ncbi:MAG: Leucyl-tRNA synthetase, partial [uncultured Chloroflexia bacterium]
RDWLISRQRYWGTPIPFLYCDSCGLVPEKEENLPVVLPTDVAFMPTGESPLKHHAGFLHATCPECGGPAVRETDTMDVFVDSSWYWFRYLSPHKDDAPLDKELAAKWTPVEQYTGGVEHAILHLLYARFFTKVIRDLGFIDSHEPFQRLRNQGMILGEDNEKMSKSRGNVVNPDDLVAEYGADTVRAYLMFIGPWEAGGPWSSTGIEGVARFLNRVWALLTEAPEREAAADTGAQKELRRAVHHAVKEVSDDLAGLQFNTAIAELMTLTNAMSRAKSLAMVKTETWLEGVKKLLLLLAPIAPHLADELWERGGFADSVHQQTWPEFDPAALEQDTVTIAVQVSGKRRGEVTVPKDANQDAVLAAAKAEPNVVRHVEGKQIVREIVVPGRLVNIVVKG